ncbi:MAG TPA: hypothetical protein DCY03_30545 [Planctomycetaceae bacterium]|nr:hypothetical protein [Planctomycetaceae bacterium]
MNGLPKQNTKQQPIPQAKEKAETPQLKSIKDAEMKAILDNILGETETKASQAQFQVEDKPFRFDNSTIEQLKKKPVTVK